MGGEYYGLPDVCFIAIPKVNNRTSVVGKLDLIERLATEAIAPPRECPEHQLMSDIKKYRRERISVPVEITV